jgi:hypothetical protein
MIHQKVTIPLPPYLQKPTRTTRQYHPRTWRRFVRIGSTGDQWNLQDWCYYPRISWIFVLEKPRCPSLYHFYLVYVYL